MLYYAETGLWLYDSTQCGKYFSFCIDFCLATIVILLACLLDCISIHKMRVMNKVASRSDGGVGSFEEVMMKRRWKG